MQELKLCGPQFLHGGWPESLPEDSGPQRYGPKRSQWVRVPEDLTLAEARPRLTPPPGRAKII